jgi:hypothetical protein
VVGCEKEGIAMARRISQSDPALEIPFFLSGFYTFRSQLFAPYKAIGVSIVSYHDPVLDGANFENTDLFEWQRRPGFSRYCPTLLPSNEVINQFMFFRNLKGQVVDYFDSTARLATFTSTGVNTIVAKTTTAQGYISTLGNMTYFADGAAADYSKSDGTNTSAWGIAAPTIVPTSTGMGFWQPEAKFVLGEPIQDPNGNIEAVSAILIPNGSVESPTAYTELALAGGIGAWGSGSITAGSNISQTIVTVGHTKYLFLYDFNLSIPAGATIIGISASVPKQIIGGTAVDQSVKLVVGGSVVGADLASGAPWSTSAFVTSIYGGPTNTWSSSLTATQASTQGPSGFGLAIAANVTSTTNYNLVQSGTSNSFVSASTVYTFPNPVTVGNTIVIGLLMFHEGFVSISDNHGNVYTQAVSTVNGEEYVAVFVAPVLTTGATTITVVTSGLNFNTITGINAHEFHGVLSASAIATTGANNTPASPFNSGTVTVSNADDLIFSFLWQSPGATIPVGYTRATVQDIYDSPGGAPFTAQAAAAFYAPGSTGSFSPTWSQGSIGVTAVLKSAESATVSVGGGAPNSPIITIYYQLPTGVGPGFSGPTEPIWSTTTGGTVNDAGLAWTNYGPVEIWFPLTNYPVPVVVLDSNGNLQLATTTTNPVAPWDSGTGYAVNAVVSYGGGYWINVLGATNTGNPPNSLASTATTSGSTTITTAYWAVASNPVVTGLIAPVWQTTLGALTVDGNYTWKNLGPGSPLASFGHAYVYGYRTVYGHLSTCSPFSNNTGAILGPLNGSISSYAISSNVVTFQGSNNFQIGDIFTVTGLTVGTYLNEQVFTVTSAVPSAIFPLTSVAVSGSNVLTILAINNLVVGQTVTFSNVANATFLNGVTVTVLASGLSATQFEANFTHASYGATADTGSVLINGSWTANFVFADTSSTSDSGTAAPLLSTIAGVGTGSPLCNSIAAITAFSVTANIITLTASNNFQPGLWVTLTGLSVATFLNGQQVQVIAVDQPVGIQNTWFQVYFQTPNSVQTPDAGTATFNAVEIYRTSDGGGTYLFDGAVTNPGLNLPWVFDDFVIDANLDILLIAPLYHQNDPPPGAPGSSINTVGALSVYWQGRIWLVVGNYVYYTSGPDCTNGIPEEAWAPGNRFQFSGPVMNLQPTADGVALLVFLADSVNAILGGPETISFYASDFLSNFGISSSNAIFRDGSTIGLFTTQKQYFELLGAQKDDVGKNISNYLAANFAAAKSYVTMHRNGTDVGLFISNGVDRILRFGPDVPSWSVPAFPSFGAGAIRSVETSVGEYSLLLATPNGGPNNYIYARDLNSWGDNNTTLGANDGASYPSCYITVGSITLSPLGGRGFPLQHVSGYFDAVGTLANGGPSQPNIWILPNEVSGTSGIGFIQLPEVVQEPPQGQNYPSTTLLALRWNVNMMNSSLASQFMHHIQVKIQFESENAPNTIKAISFGEDQST